jgi:anti-sigma factor RsiW
MLSSENNLEAGCRNVQELLSDYLENTLAARQALEVEKHLAGCAECASLAREMRATIHLLRNAETYDTGDDFMARLHARLDGLEPEPARRRTALVALRDWLEGFRQNLNARRVPALSVGLAMAALVAIVIVQRPMPATENPPTHPAIPAAPLQHNVALTASNPFDDPYAAKAAEDYAAADTKPRQDSM